MELPNKHYKLILADPPWSYENKKIYGAHNRVDIASGASDIYPTMLLEEIKGMDIPSIAEKDSSLFLWATTPLLPEALDVMNAWGFRYKTAIYWRKIMSKGYGFWFRGQVEICLIGIKGTLKAFHSQRPNFIQTKARAHSQNPDELYGIIEELNLNPKIELFARNKREGWDAWGLEVPNHCQKLLLEL